MFKENGFMKFWGGGAVTTISSWYFVHMIWITGAGAWTW